MKHGREIESLTAAVTSTLVCLYRCLPKHHLPTVARQKSYDFNPPKTQLEADDREFARRITLITIHMNTPRRRDDVN